MYFPKVHVNLENQTVPCGHGYLSVSLIFGLGMGNCMQESYTMRLILLVYRDTYE